MKFNFYVLFVAFSGLLSTYPAAAMDCFKIFKKKAPKEAVSPHQIVMPPSFEELTYALIKAWEKCSMPMSSQEVSALERAIQRLQEGAKDSDQRIKLLKIASGLLTIDFLADDISFLSKHLIAWERVTNFLFNLILFQKHYPDAWKFGFSLNAFPSDQFCYTTELIKVKQKWEGDGGAQQKAFALNGAKKIIDRAIKSLGYGREWKTNRKGSNIELYTIVKIKKDRCAEYELGTANYSFSSDDSSW
jgi:hypothetical protein